MLADELATLMVSQNVAGLPGSTQATVTGWTLAKGELPELPDRIVAIFETGGFPDELGLTGDIERPTFQIRVRGSPKGYATARTKCDAIRTALHTIGNENLAGRRFVHLLAATAPIALGQDANNRPGFSINGQAVRSQTT